MSLAEPASMLEEEVSNTFVQRLHGEWTKRDQALLERRLATDPAYAETYRLAGESFDLLREHAEMPEMMQFRERALAHARRSSVNRWLRPNPLRLRESIGVRGPALAAGLFLALLIGWQLSPWGYHPGQYRTRTGEQRIVELDDHSRVALDAQTQIAVRYTNESRTIELIEGQAQFSVAKDNARPFKVQAGDRIIIALGTVFTVEFTGQNLHVAMLEGKVAVTSTSSTFSTPGEKEGVRSAVMDERLSGEGNTGRAGGRDGRQQGLNAIKLSAGEELRVGQDGRTTLIPKADLEAATAWRNGKVVFRTERLAEAIKRMNRYSRVQLAVDDPALADETISGVFEAGDTQGFVAGVQLALPVVADYDDRNTVRLALNK